MRSTGRIAKREQDKFANTQEWLASGWKLIVLYAGYAAVQVIAFVITVYIPFFIALL